MSAILKELTANPKDYEACKSVGKRSQEDSQHLKQPMNTGDKGSERLSIDSNDSAMTFSDADVTNFLI